MRFFVDNNLSVHLARGMKEFGEDLVHLQDHFPPDTKDVDFLPWLGQQGLLLLSRDRNQLKHADEIALIRKHQVGAFYLSGKGLNACQLIQQLVRNWPAIKEKAVSTRRPFAFLVRPHGGKLEPLPL